MRIGFFIRAERLSRTTRLSFSNKVPEESRGLDSVRRDRIAVCIAPTRIDREVCDAGWSSGIVILRRDGGRSSGSKLFQAVSKYTFTPEQIVRSAMVGKKTRLGDPSNRLSLDLEAKLINLERVLLNSCEKIRGFFFVANNIWQARPRTRLHRLRRGEINHRAFWRLVWTGRRKDFREPVHTWGMIKHARGTLSSPEDF